MKINLIQDEIEEALVAFIANQGIDLRDKTISVELTAGRKGNGHTAQISLVKDGEASKTPEETEEEVSDDTSFISATLDV